MRQLVLVVLGWFHAGFFISVAPLYADAPQTPVPAPVLTVKVDHPACTYQVGEQVTWTVEVKSGERSALNAVPYRVTKDGAEVVSRGTINLSSGSAAFMATRNEPGVLLAMIGPPPAPGSSWLALGGALVAPEKISPAFPAPEDFDAFWQVKLQELASVPAHPVVEKASLEEIKDGAGIEYEKVTLDNIRNTKVWGQLAHPSAGDKFPAILLLQAAGVYPLKKSWVVNLAKQGFLVLDIEAHDIPIDENPAFYEDAQQHALNGYPMIGCEDRETSYFLRMFLGDVRAAQYLTSRPDWDGKVLIVNGDSQGGMQAFATAALFPQVTHMTVLVPAGCDVLAPLAVPPRMTSWPGWLSPTNLQKHDEAKVRQTAIYFDPIYFAARIKIPALVAPGLLDETARPGGILAAYNALAGPKELVLMPLSTHHGDPAAQNPYHSRADAWRNAIKAGQPVPLRPRTD